MSSTIGSTFTLLAPLAETAFCLPLGDFASIVRLIVRDLKFYKTVLASTVKINSITYLPSFLPVGEMQWFSFNGLLFVSPEDATASLFSSDAYAFNSVGRDMFNSWYKVAKSRGIMSKKLKRNSLYQKIARLKIKNFTFQGYPRPKTFAKC